MRTALEVTLTVGVCVLTLLLVTFDPNTEGSAPTLTTAVGSTAGDASSGEQTSAPDTRHPDSASPTAASGFSEAPAYSPDSQTRIVLLLTPPASPPPPVAPEATTAEDQPAEADISPSDAVPESATADVDDMPHRETAPPAEQSDSTDGDIDLARIDAEVVPWLYLVGTITRSDQTVYFVKDDRSRRIVEFTSHDEGTGTAVHDGNSRTDRAAEPDRETVSSNPSGGNDGRDRTAEDSMIHDGPEVLIVRYEDTLYRIPK
jgi:hypothetical protein